MSENVELNFSDLFSDEELKEIEGIDLTEIRHVFESFDIDSMVSAFKHDNYISIKLGSVEEIISLISILDNYTLEEISNKKIDIITPSTTILDMELLEEISSKINVEDIYLDPEGGDPIGYYKYSKDEYSDILRKINDITSKIDTNLPDIDKFAIIYKYLGSKISYEFNEDGNPSKRREAHNLIGPLFEDSAVCQGYALTLKEILNNLNIECKYISGKTTKDADSAHAWNQVRVDGRWYNCDLTWDSPLIAEGRSLEYCLQSDDEFLFHDENAKGKEKCYYSYNLETMKQYFPEFKNKRIDKYRATLELYSKGQNLLPEDELRRICSELGLDFEKEIINARDRAKFKDYLDNNEIILDENEFIKSEAERLGLDIESELMESGARKFIRSEMVKYFRKESSMSREIIDEWCSSFGMSFNYEMTYARDSIKEGEDNIPINELVMDSVKKIANAEKARGVQSVQSELKNDYLEIEKPTQTKENSVSLDK